MRVTPGYEDRLCTIQPDSMVELEDIDGETAIFSASGHWYLCHLDEFVESTRARDSSAAVAFELQQYRWRRVSRVMSSDEPPATRSESKERTILCKEGLRLLDAFGVAIRELLLLHEQQFMAVLEGDLDSSRFDLLIHMASEKKQEAKYAYLLHMDTHGCSTKNAADKR